MAASCVRFRVRWVIPDRAVARSYRVPAKTTMVVCMNASRCYFYQIRCCLADSFAWRLAGQLNWRWRSRSHGQWNGCCDGVVSTQCNRWRWFIHRNTWKQYRPTGLDFLGFPDRLLLAWRCNWMKTGRSTTKPQPGEEIFARPRMALFHAVSFVSLILLVTY